MTSGDFMCDVYRNLEDSIYSGIKENAQSIITELLEQAKLNPGDILVVGCSSSEILGSKIGKGSSYSAAEAVFDVIYPMLCDRGIYIAAQCCEHLNRALVIEKQAAEKYGLEIVCAIPQPKAGGSFATVTYKNLKEPVLVESVKAHAGIDIGGTLIGMHLKQVAVPVRTALSKIGEANIICARTRPKFIGGERTVYK